MVSDAQNQLSATYYAAAQTSLIENTAPGRSDTGELVTVDSALSLAAVWEAVSLISGHIAGMEIQIKRKTGDGITENVTQHPVYQLLNRAPNEYQTPFAFRECLMAWALLQGNGRAHIVRNGLGQAVRLDPLPPWYTYTVILDGKKFHATYYHPDLPGASAWESGDGNVELYDDADVLHIQGLTYNGFWGMHLIQVARNVLGVALSGVQRISSSFANAGMPGFLIELPAPIYRNPKQRAEFRREWDARYSGTRNAGKMQLLPEGFKAHSASVSNNDAQLNELATHTTEQIRRLFLLPPNDASAYKSITERNTQYINNCLSRWMQKWVQEIRAKLFTDRDRLNDRHCAVFDTSMLIKGDPNNWAAYTSSLRQQGLINGNEGREMHAFNPVDDPALETYGNPNITTAGEAVESEAAAEDAASDNTEADSETDSETSDNTEALNLARDAVLLHFENLISAEIKWAKSQSGKADFSDRIGRYYDTHKARFCALCERLGVDTGPVKTHIDRSRSELIECAATADPFAAVSATVETWQSRAKGLIEHVEI